MIGGNQNSSSAKLTIWELPSELLFEIFKWVKDNDLDNVQRVCPWWYSIIDEWVGRAVSTSVRRIIHPSNPALNRFGSGLELISEIGVSSFEVEAHNINSSTPNLLEHLPSPLPSFKRPYLLRRLFLRRELHPDLFNSLVKGTVNLSKFMITVHALAYLRESDLQRLQFPRLRELEIFTGGYGQRAVSLPNLRTLLKENYFRMLAHLYVHFPIESTGDLETVNGLVRFILAHSRLSKVIIIMNLPIPSQFAPVARSTYQDELRKILSEIHGRGGCRSLKTLIIHGIPSNRNGVWPQLQIWNEFIQSQDSLQTLKVGPISMEMLNTIFSRNGATLEKVELDMTTLTRDAPEPGQFDCAVFSSLERVHTIEMTLADEVTGTSYLPQSLVDFHLVIKAGDIRSDELDHILLRLPNLQKIYIDRTYPRDDGREGYGVRVETLRQFIRNREVLHLRLLMVGGFPLEQLPNGDPRNPSALPLNVDSRVIDWKLSYGGYYRLI